jgi:hypothetical protein
VEHLAFALWSVRSFTKQNNLRLLRHEFSWKRRRKRKREKLNRNFIMQKGGINSNSHSGIEVKIK